MTNPTPPRPLRLAALLAALALGASLAGGPGTASAADPSETTPPELAAGEPAASGADAPTPAVAPVLDEATDMVFVPAGPFVMGYDGHEAHADTRPAHRVELGPFWIDRTEVTAGEYAACIEAGVCTEGRTMGHCEVAEAQGPHFPAWCVDWSQAQTFCRWEGKQLPSEAEWEKAARGTDGRLHPWGDEPPTCELAVMNDGRPGCGEGLPAAVGSRPAGASPYGALDMEGNVFEWVRDNYGADHYSVADPVEPGGPEEGGMRVLRGGSWGLKADRLGATLRSKLDPRLQIRVGFRCSARGSEPPEAP